MERVRGRDLELKVSGCGSRVSGFEFWVSGFGIRVSGFGFRVLDFWFWVSSSGFGVYAPQQRSASAREPETEPVWPANSAHLRYGPHVMVINLTSW